MSTAHHKTRTTGEPWTHHQGYNLDTSGDGPASPTVWARLGLEEMASPASTETSRASLRLDRTPQSHTNEDDLVELNSRLVLRVLFES